MGMLSEGFRSSRSSFGKPNWGYSAPAVTVKTEEELRLLAEESEKLRLAEEAANEAALEELRQKFTIPFFYSTPEGGVSGIDLCIAHLLYSGQSGCYLRSDFTGTLSVPGRRGMEEYKFLNGKEVKEDEDEAEVVVQPKEEVKNNPFAALLKKK